MAGEQKEEAKTLPWRDNDKDITTRLFARAQAYAIQHEHQGRKAKTE
jgi:hypothetical protein